MLAIENEPVPFTLLSSAAAAKRFRMMKTASFVIVRCRNYRYFAVGVNRSTGSHRLDW